MAGIRLAGYNTKCSINVAIAVSRHSTVFVAFPQTKRCFGDCFPSMASIVVYASNSRLSNGRLMVDSAALGNGSSLYGSKSYRRLPVHPPFVCVCDIRLVCDEKVELLNTVREHVLRLEDKQQELKAKLLKMTASLEAAREEHKVTKWLRWRRQRRRRQRW